MASSTSILVHNNKILLILRDNKPEIPKPNIWRLPGGGVEEGEDYFQAISRELEEEISIIPQKLEFFNLEDVLKINLTRKLQFYINKFRDGIVELINNGEVGDIAKLGLN